jgi:rRNA maturation protein Nop10
VELAHVLGAVDGDEREERMAVTMRREQCAVCGGWIKAPGDDWDAVAAAVREHGRSQRHNTTNEYAAIRNERQRRYRVALREAVEVVRVKRATAA